MLRESALPNPILSIVTVTFNARQAFLKTSASVQGQTCRRQIEYLVIDGQSSDGTIEAIREAASVGTVDSWISEPDSGIYDAMNKAVARARGEFVLFLNSGDVLAAHDTIEQLLSHGEAPDFVWGDCEIDAGGRLVRDEARRMERFLYRQMTVSHQSLAVRTELLRTHPFSLNLRVCADYEVLCHLVTAGYSGVYRPLVVSRVEQEGFSSRNFFRGLDEKRRISRQYFPQEQWRATPYFILWGLYMRLKIWYKERS